MSDAIDVITRLQTEKGVTNKEIEKACGLSNSVISQWKAGRSKPSVDAILRLARYFGVTTDYLLGFGDREVLIEIKNNAVVLTPEEELILEAYAVASVEGRFKIIQTCMNEKEKAHG